MNTFLHRILEAFGSHSWTELVVPSALRRRGVRARRRCNKCKRTEIIKLGCGKWTESGPTIAPKSHPDDKTCLGCGMDVDETVCHCGIPLESHGFETHTFTPITCECGDDK